MAFADIRKIVKLKYTFISVVPYIPKNLAKHKQSANKKQKVR